MPFVLEDPSRLNRASVQAMVPVASPADLAALHADGDAPIALAGMRCSQGGHTLVEGGRIALTETLLGPITVNLNGYDPARAHEPCAATVDVPAGATWSRLHRALAPHGLAPLVQQSSAQFTVGGALSVNCHGRDPRQGPVSTTARGIRVWRPDGAVDAAPTGPHAGLFRAAVGGYGSCGPILQATLQLCPNHVLKPRAQVMSRGDYQQQLLRLANRQADAAQVHMHYGWLRCTSTWELFTEVLSVSHVCDDPSAVETSEVLDDEPWGTGEVLRAGWAAAREGYDSLRVQLWDLLYDTVSNPKPKSRLNWLRPSTTFLAGSDEGSSDMLQEFFVPVERVSEALDAYARVLKEHRVNVMSGTVRLVRGEDQPVNMSYCDTEDRACIALDIHIRTDGGKPEPATWVWMRRLLDATHSLGGSFYLPYPRLPDPEHRQQVQRFYGGGWAAQKAAIDQYNTERRFWSSFLAATF